MCLLGWSLGLMVSSPLDNSKSTRPTLLSASVPDWIKAFGFIFQIYYITSFSTHTGIASSDRPSYHPGQQPS